MKTLITLLLTLFTLAAGAQKTLLPAQGNPNTIQHYVDALGADSVLLFAPCNDTPKINMYAYQIGSKKWSALSLDTVSNTWKYWWNGWHVLSSGGSTTPAGNYGAIQMNRDGEFAATDSLKFGVGALFVTNKIISQDITAYNGDETKSIGTNSGSLQLQFNAGGISGRLNANNVSGVKDIALPNISGNLAEGVTDGTTTVHANAGGEVDISTITDKYVNKDSVAELTTDTHLNIAPDGDDLKISLDNITGFVAGSAVSGTGTDVDPYTINTQTTITGNAGTATKLATGRTLAITGDLAWTSPSFDGSGNVTAAGTLATVNSNVGTFTNPSVTVNAKGLVTAISNGVSSIPKFRGEEYYKYSGWSNLNDFTNNTMSATVSSGNIVIPDANVSDFTKYLTLDSINCTNHWKIIMLFKRTANPGGGGSGISLGMQSVNTDAICSNAVYFAGAGTLQYFYNSNGGGWATGIGGTSSALTYSNGDTIRLVIQRDNQHVSVVAENLSNGAAAARQIDLDINITSGPILPNTARWTIFAQGGTFNVISLRCINNEVQTPNVLVIGDSKTMGFGATNYDSTVTGQLKKWYNGVAVSGGFGDKISDMLLRLPELLSMHAKVVVLNSLGSNDIRFGRSVSATMADYATLRQAFIDDGSTVIDVSPCYESAQDLTALYLAWKTTYGANGVDIFNLPHQYGLSGDGIHDNDDTQKAWMKRLLDLNVFEGAKN